jgi:chaperone required for assembly of F1-ATPase
MAIGLLAVLSSVPWDEVIKNAPKVVNSAKKLWNAVIKKSSPSDASDSNEKLIASSESHAIAAIEARTIALETAVSDLNSQMLESSELIKTLADQNAQLIRHIETNRVRIIWLTAATIGFAITALLGLFIVHFSGGIVY